jgi:hypothetical protein
MRAGIAPSPSHEPRTRPLCLLGRYNRLFRALPTSLPPPHRHTHTPDIHRNTHKHKHNDTHTEAHRTELLLRFSAPSAVSRTRSLAPNAIDSSTRRWHFRPLQSMCMCHHACYGCAGVCFESITVSGAESLLQASKFGTYTKLANVTQGGRPVYQRVGSTVAYLFYWPSTRNWLIGSSYSSGPASFQSTGSAGAACPDQATGWHAYSGGASVGNYAITVAPAAGQTRSPTLPTPTAPPTKARKRSRYIRMRQGVL